MWKLQIYINKEQGKWIISLALQMMFDIKTKQANKQTNKQTNKQAKVEEDNSTWVISSGDIMEYSSYIS